MDPNIKRLAVLTEDHPTEHRKFEEIIPEGNYGAGLVKIWDEGDYELASLDKVDTQKFLRDGFNSGNLKFRLHGKLLTGDFTLIRLKGEKAKQWLLIKKADATTPVEIALKTEVAKIKPMRATLSNEIFNHKNWIFEIKWDGYQALSDVHDGHVELYSRNGNCFNAAYPAIVTKLKK